MLRYNLYNKKILLSLVVFFSVFTNNVYSDLSYENSINKINNKLINIYSILDTRSFKKQTDFYKIFKEMVESKKIKITDTNKLELIIYIEDSLDNKYQTYKLLHQEKLIYEEERAKELEEKNKITQHRTLILKFTKNWNHDLVINPNKQLIIEAWSVFIFRRTSDLTSTDIQSITNKIKAINNDILFFIDQEWWFINRYIDYSSKTIVDNLFNSSAVEQKTRLIFPYTTWSFPSLAKIWIHYDTFSTDEDKQAYLNKVASIRLQWLKDHWINTYWLVLDLNRGNPVISNYSRSFSKHVEKYKKLVDAFSIASKETWVKLYFKHFPWHWEWNIDSHVWILNLIWKETYIQDNIELFDYALTKNPTAWLMIWHMYIPNSKKQYFIDTVNKSNFLLTDDLWMQWYKQAKWKLKESLFFTTDQIINYDNLITVDSVAVSWIK